MNDLEDIMDLSLTVGGMMLESNAEIYRAEEVIVNILHCYGIEDVSIFTLATCIYLTVHDDQGKSKTQIKRIYHRETNLQRISDLNQYSRNLRKYHYSIEESYQYINKIKNAIGSTKIMKAFWICLSCCMFGIMFNGSITIIEFVLIFVITYATYLFSCVLSARDLNQFISNFILSAFMTFFACLAHYLGFTSNPDTIVIGTIMVLVPGVAITNAVRDVINGDILSGTIRALEAITVAFGIAAGVLTTLYFYNQGGSLL